MFEFSLAIISEMLSNGTKNNQQRNKHSLFSLEGLQLTFFFCFKFPNTICYDNFAFVYQIFTFTRESDTAYSILKIKSDKCKCSNTSFTPQPTNPHPIPLSLTPLFNNKKPCVVFATRLRA